MPQYVTKTDDMVDAICYKQYGSTGAYVEAVLAANPGLAAQGPFLPAGITIELPEFAQQPTVETVKLWD
jgi:phage tail protein X